MADVQPVQLQLVLVPSGRRPLPATHTHVSRSGFDLVSLFFFADGNGTASLSIVSGVVLTHPIARGVLEQTRETIAAAPRLRELQQDVRARVGDLPSKPPPSDAYWEVAPSRAVASLMSAIPEFDTVYLFFAAPDPLALSSVPPGHQARTPSVAEISLNATEFVLWSLRLERLVDAQANPLEAPP